MYTRLVLSERSPWWSLSLVLPGGGVKRGEKGEERGRERGGAYVRVDRRRDGGDGWC